MGRENEEKGGKCDSRHWRLRYLAITEDEWQVFFQNFQTSLDKFLVPPAEQRELLAIVASTEADIVSA